MMRSLANDKSVDTTLCGFANGIAVGSSASADRPVARSSGAVERREHDIPTSFTSELARALHHGSRIHVPLSAEAYINGLVPREPCGRLQAESTREKNIVPKL